jgi:2-polyprenyl-6-methoxyphenol hydroxylase-like FAD-dependent oxidoreductase
MRAIVVGGGIGGLSAALSLHAVGIDVDVYESAREHKPLGVGINVLPHAVRELTELGLGPELAVRGIATQALVYASRHGKEIWREPRGLDAGYLWPQFSIHRGTLQMLLLDAVLDRLGRAHVHMGCKAERVASSRHGAELSLRTPSGDARVTGDFVVAADGIHSTLRAQFYPHEGPPKWNRRVLWRGVTESEPFWGGRTMVMAGYQDEKFVCYPISPEVAARGRSLLNWVAELRFPDTQSWRSEDWSREGRLEDFLPAFESWRFEWLDVPGLIRSAPRVYEYPLVDRDPVDRWTFGRTTLLGDAAHPMYPIGSNGASQAILDARALAFELATCDDVATALDRYEQARRPATSKLVLANRGNGPEQVMQIVHERAPHGFSRLECVITREELEAINLRYKQLAGFECATLNARPSLTPPVRATMHDSGKTP